MIKLFVGLGNPGPEYEGTRHNAGFWFVDALARELKTQLTPERSYWGLAARVQAAGASRWLLEPQTFMNLSGQSVGEAMRYLKLAPDAVTVFHDELDLAPGKLRLKQGGGHAGHNGLRSIHQHIGEGYARVRLGIGHPGHKDRVAPYVLSDFAKADADWLNDLLRGLSKAAPWLAEGNGARFQNVVAEQMPPARNNPAPEKPRAAAPEAAPAPETPRSMGDRLAALAQRFKP